MIEQAAVYLAILAVIVVPGFLAAFLSPKWND
ncbi:protein MgtS [Dickeya dianthicola]|nr:protein MgtS [Dickeya dianthicola]MBI0437649.1 protein MgtS [Dickeya dianthicola]MBI0449044.1 protein MgtS [Dickeya dianthicola]MBI0453494.1 protein MgtS [Dickeya dianthicola]MBI0457843.1 protein MgtS [Dickeya dianthicola]MBI0461380.1 protein MgtS [Dickeya dianthicola]